MYAAPFALGVIILEDYSIPAAAACATVVEKKSEFIAALSPVETEAEALDFLQQIKTEHRTANHNVYAYVLREGARSRYSDDGEPTKTAGLPVLSVIQHAALCNCIIVVTRYFGGTLLGTGGLVRAYTAAAQAAIQAAGTLRVRTVCRLRLALPYPLYQQALRLVEGAGARLEGEPEFGTDVQLTAVLLQQGSDALVQSLRQLFRGDEGITLSPPFQMPF